MRKRLYLQYIKKGMSRLVTSNEGIQPNKLSNSRWSKSENSFEIESFF